jgi:site-specific recombinase XerD
VSDGYGDIETARILLARIGVTPEQLLAAASPGQKNLPTFREYIAQLSDSVPASTRRAYATYWRRIVDKWGDRQIDEPTPLEIQRLCESQKLLVVTRKGSRGGRSATEHLIAALRCMYLHAVADNLIDERDNPAIRVAKPRRLPSTRRAIPENRLAELFAVAASTGDDPELDTLILRLHTETACRRGGALALRPCNLDTNQSLVMLREKGDTTRWQPVSPTLTRHLLDHAAARGAGSDARLLRYRNGRPITARRYDYLWTRIRDHLPWAAAQQVSAHWLRHTTLTWVERRFGYAVARAYAGHTDSSNAGTTATYIRADIHEVAAALAALTGEPHPLANPDVR